MKPKAHQRTFEHASMVLSQARDGKRFGRLTSRMTITLSMIVIGIGMVMQPMTTNATTSRDCHQNLKHLLQGTLELARKTKSQKNDQTSSDGCMIASVQDVAKFASS